MLPAIIHILNNLKILVLTSFKIQFWSLYSSRNLATLSCLCAVAKWIGVFPVFSSGAFGSSVKCTIQILHNVQKTCSCCFMYWSPSILISCNRRGSEIHIRFCIFSIQFLSPNQNVCRSTILFHNEFTNRQSVRLFLSKSLEIFSEMC